MALKLFQTKNGFSDGLVSYLSGAGVPGADASFQDAAGIGSLYNNTTDGSTYKKDTAGAGTANWVKQANITDLAGLSSAQSWREPVIVRDAANTTTGAAVIEMNVADTLDGITIASGDRVLLSEVAGGAGPNVYIVGGVTGNWTLTEDANLETAGDTTQVLSGTSANQIWFFDGTVWAYIGSQSSSEDGFLRAFMGKGAAGAELPAYTSVNYVANSDSLETAIGKLDAQASLNAIAASNASGGVSGLQTELDNTQTGAGLGVGGTFTTLAGSNYATTATSIVGAITELDTNVAAAFGVTNGNVTTNASGVANNLAEINLIETATGLDANGNFVTFVGTNYLGAATSITTSLSALDTQVGTNTGDIATNTLGLSNLTLTVNTNTGNISTNTLGLSNEITNRANADTAIDNKIGNQLYTSNNFVVDGTSSTVAISVLDAALSAAVTGSTGTGTNITVDSVLVDNIEVAKWILSVTDSVTGDKYSAEILATHNGTAAADATVSDWNDYGELELGAVIAGLAVDITLTGTGITQAMNLVVAGTNSLTVVAKRLSA